VLFTAALAMGVLVACGRTPEGDLTIDRPGDIDVDITTDTLRMPDMGPDTVVVDTLRRDTLHRDTVLPGRRP
jgi:hypothetical protein